MFVSATIYQKAKQLALKEGLSASQWSSHSHHKDWREAADYVPMELLWEIYEKADTNLSDGFSIRQGQQLQADDYGPLGLSWKTCWRAKEVLERTVRYMILVTDHGSARYKENGQSTKITMLRDAHRRAVEMTNETSFVMLVNVLREVTGKNISPTQVKFKHWVPEVSSFTHFFKGKVTMEASENSMEFLNSDIDIPTLKADKAIHSFLVDQLEKDKQSLETKADAMIRNIHQIIEDSLPSGIPSLSQMAENFNTSERTLKRRMAEKKLSFRQLVQNIQQKTARKLLEQTDSTVGEIAFQTGYSDQTAFQRAFKRWMGQSPMEYRNIHGL